MELNKLIEMGMEGQCRLDDDHDAGTLARCRVRQRTPTAPGRHPDPDPLGAPPLVRPRRLRAPDRARGQLEAHAGRPASRRCFDERGRRRMPSPSTVTGAASCRARLACRVGRPRPAARSSRPRTCPRRSRGRARPRRTSCASRRMPSSPSRSSSTIARATAVVAHAHLVIEAMPNSHAHDRAAPRRVGAARAERRDHRPRRRAPHASSRCSSGTTTPCTRHPTRPASIATRPCATSSSASAAASCASTRASSSPAPARRRSCTACQLLRRRSAPREPGLPVPQGRDTTRRRALQGRAAGRRRPQRLDRRRAHRARRRRHRLVRGQPQPRPHRRRARRVDPEPRDRDRRHPRRRPRQRHRPLRRRAAVLPAVARHQRGRGAPPRGHRLPQRDRPADRHPRSRGTSCSRPSRAELAQEGAAQ